MRVIDLLEPIEVEHQQRTTALRGLERLQGRLQPLVHTMPVRKAGKGIELGHSLRI